MSRTRRGFTLMEVLVILAILAMLAAVIVTQLAPRIFQGQAAALGSTFGNLADGVSAFRQDVGRYPQRLSHLDDPIVATTQFDVCHSPGGYPATYVTRWRGPYVDRVIEPAGLIVGDATVTDSIERNPLGGATVFSTMFFVAIDVDTAVFASLEGTFDIAPLNAGTGTIRWVENGTTNRGTLRYALPIRGC